MLRFTIFFAFLTYVYAVEVAVVYIFDPTGASNVSGTVTFRKLDDGISIIGAVERLSEGNHGFHIHSLGNIAGGCGSTGPHFNPHNVTHGGPDNPTRHVGDLGNIAANSAGIAVINFNDSVIALDGDHSIIGRAVVVHQGEDDLGKGNNTDSLVTGNAGARLACGVIGIGEDSGAQHVSSSLITIALALAFCLRTTSY